MRIKLVNKGAVNLNKIHKDSCFSEKVNHSMIHFFHMTRESPGK